MPFSDLSDFSKTIFEDSFSSKTQTTRRMVCLVQV